MKYRLCIARTHIRMLQCVTCRQYMAARARSCEPHLGRWDNGCLKSVRQQDDHSCGPFVLLVRHYDLTRIKCANALYN